MKHLQKINKLLSRSRLTEADTIRFGRQIKRRIAKKIAASLKISKKSTKSRLLKQGLADARKHRLVKAKENYTEKPLSETNPYLRDPKLRDKMILVSAASSAAQAIRAKRSAGPGGGPAAAIEGIRVPQKVIAKGLRPGWKPRRTRRRS